MNNENICKFCEKELEPHIHGNSSYCNEVCYSKMKSRRSKDQYQANVKLKEAFEKSDKILEIFHDTYGSEQFIPAILLDQAAMEWLISQRETTIEELPVKVIGKYGYCLFTNETLKIWKI